jgi:TetR/AcrR family hemagglutinin/protease transcriptional regulator
VPRSPASAATPRARARRLSPDARRNQLLGCAIAVFARRGFSRAGHAEIARRAGVSVPAVFVYFPTQRELVRAVQREVARFYLEIARHVHDSDEPAPAVILAHANAFAASVDSHPDRARVWLDWSTAVRAETWPAYLAFESEIAGVLAATLCRGQRQGSISPDVHPDDGARIAIGAAHMIARMKFSRRPASEMDRFLRAVVRALTGGLAA